MKKQLLNLSLVAVGLALYIGSAFATPTAPVNSMEVPAAYTAPTLDGVVDDAYGDEQSTVLMYDAQAANWTGASDFTAVFHVCYDKENLYLVSIITDDVEEDYTWDYSSEWMFDNFEVFLQLDTNTTYIRMTICQNNYVSAVASTQFRVQVPQAVLPGVITWKLQPEPAGYPKLLFPGHVLQQMEFFRKILKHTWM